MMNHVPSAVPFRVEPAMSRSAMLRVPMLALSGLALAALTACATVQAPTERLAQSQASLRAADELGATEDPQAALYLKLAREQIDAAKVIIDEKDDDQYARADALLERAAADAELAMELARSNDARLEADRIMQDVAALRAGR
jgi:hypothetical protein